MKRLLLGFVTAIALATGLTVFTPAPLAAGQPSECHHACREAFTTCVQEARSREEAAACRVVAAACVEACSAH